MRTIDGPDNHNQVGGLNLGVYLVKRKVDGKLCVQKKIDGTQYVLRREVHLLHHLKHPNIVAFVDAFITPKPGREVSLYMEYCDLGSLGSLVKRYVVHGCMSLRLGRCAGMTRQLQALSAAATPSVLWGG